MGEGTWGGETAAYPILRHLAETVLRRTGTGQHNITCSFFWIVSAVFCRQFMVAQMGKSNYNVMCNISHITKSGDTLIIDDSWIVISAL